MFIYVVRTAYGWLAITGLMHFLVDVVSQYARGKRAPGPETSLYYGLNSAFSLGQVALGSMFLILSWQAPQLLKDSSLLLVGAAAGIGWLVLTIFFMEYREPRFAVSVYCVLAFWALFLRYR